MKKEELLSYKAFQDTLANVNKEKSIIEKHNLIDYNLNREQALRTTSLVEDSLMSLKKKSLSSAVEYAKEYKSVLDDILNDKDLKSATSSLYDLTQNINDRNFLLDMKELDSMQEELFSHEQYIPNFGGDIVKFLDIQTEKLKKLISKTEEQNKLLEKKMNDDKESARKQISSAKKQSRKAFILALASIIVAVATSIVSINKSEEIYIKEDNSSTYQYNNIIDVLEGNSKEKLDIDTAQLKILNDILVTLQHKSNDKNGTK